MNSKTSSYPGDMNAYHLNSCGVNSHEFIPADLQHDYEFMLQKRRRYSSTSTVRTHGTVASRPALEALAVPYINSRSAATHATCFSPQPLAQALARHQAHRARHMREARTIELRADAAGGRAPRAIAATNMRPPSVAIACVPAPSLPTSCRLMGSDMLSLCRMRAGFGSVAHTP